MKVENYRGGQELIGISLFQTPLSTTAEISENFKIVSLLVPNSESGSTVPARIKGVHINN